MSRYIVIGAGAVGATFAAELHRAGRHVVLAARGRHLELLRERGLDYVRPEASHRIRIPVAAGPDDIDLRPDDVLLLAVKSQDTEAALQEWAWQPVNEASAAELLPIVLLQNGRDSVRSALRRFAAVIDAVVLIAASHVTPGEVISPSAPRAGAVILGAAGAGGAAMVSSVAFDLHAANFETQVVTDIEAWKAGKLVANLGYNLDALYRPSPLRDAAARALRIEAAAVFDAAGIAVTDPRAAGHLNFGALGAQPIPGRERGGSSTWQSLARARSHEADYLNGEVALLGRLHGRPAPLNAAIAARVARASREATPPGSLGDDDLRVTLPAIAAPAVLIDAKQLRTELDGPQPPLVLDVRWALGDPNGRLHYEYGHIPGAVFADLETELADPPAPRTGRHPLPAIKTLERAARRWGLEPSRPVVVYDNAGGLAAARAWWLLRWAGHAEVRILDGALAAWRDAGLPLETGTVTPALSDITLRGGALPTLTADEAAALAANGVLLDARAAERYRGEIEPVDPRAGHIPGAISAPTGDNLGSDGAFHEADALAARFRRLGVRAGQPVGVYCGSGVTAAHQIAALAIAGIDAALYPGSWSAWSSDPDRPVVTGPSPR